MYYKDMGGGGSFAVLLLWEPLKYTKKSMEVLPKKEAIKSIKTITYDLIGDRLAHGR